ncbi:RecX family transcriptional regulator [Tahibacter harae]|uniref:Regulatory protein RecX n=1 Tax=Tahibacter harae TaxID=2963937 RepID=A0ABT1QMY1_9GAMM|nr:RecX family transcriptional regulator [Tahibacter harae]MCQ4163248.1 RecX family transcriptional regulator [Tahibacter harae]
MSSRSDGPRSPGGRGRAGRAAEPEGEGRRRGVETGAGARAGWNARPSAGRGRRDEDDAHGGRDPDDAGGSRDRADAGGGRGRADAGGGRGRADAGGSRGSADAGGSRGSADAGGRPGAPGHDYAAGRSDDGRRSRYQRHDESRDQGGDTTGQALGGDAAGCRDGDENDTGRRTRPQPSAYGKALGLLSRREHSGRELKRKLARTGYSPDETAEALGRLQEQSFQSDGRFAGLLVRSRVAQGQGPRRIRAELRSHGIDDAAAQQALIEEGADWLALARQIYRRRYGAGAAADRQETQRRAAFLLRRGFDAATVRAITHADDVDDSAEEFD